jgi:hypothetical protein
MAIKPTTMFSPTLLQAEALSDRASIWRAHSQSHGLTQAQEDALYSFGQACESWINYKTLDFEYDSDPYTPAEKSMVQKAGNNEKLNQLRVEASALRVLLPSFFEGYALWPNVADLPNGISHDELGMIHHIDVLRKKQGKKTCAQIQEERDAYFEQHPHEDYLNGHETH